MEFKVGDKVECIKCTLDIVSQQRSVVDQVWDDGTLSVECSDEVHCQNRFKIISKPAIKTKENTMNKNIVAAFPKTDDAVLVEEQLGSEIKEGFINGLVIKQYAKEILVEAKSRKAEEEK